MKHWGCIQFPSQLFLTDSFCPFQFQGAPAELTLNGTVRGKFSPASNKLVSAKISCDTGSALFQLQKIASVAPVYEQAQAAQADAILDSLCLPSGTVPSAVIVHSSSSSEGSMDKGEQISDESDGEHAGGKRKAISA